MLSSGWWPICVIILAKPVPILLHWLRLSNPRRLQILENLSCIDRCQNELYIMQIRVLKVMEHNSNQKTTCTELLKLSARSPRDTIHDVITATRNLSIVARLISLSAFNTTSLCRKEVMMSESVSRGVNKRASAFWSSQHPIWFWTCFYLVLPHQVSLLLASNDRSGATAKRLTVLHARTTLAERARREKIEQSLRSADRMFG